MVITIKNEINISYPRTNYPILNREIGDKIKKLIDDFMDYAKEETTYNFTYTLDITYDEYGNENYLSYVFYTSTYTGGAHPDNQIFTINYDITKNKIVTIEDIIENESTLIYLSDESRKILKKNEYFLKNKSSFEMLIEGTTPTKENFKNFAYTENGLIIYFEQYQVAPYAAGSFKVLIPYKKK